MLSEDCPPNVLPFPSGPREQRAERIASIERMIGIVQAETRGWHLGDAAPLDPTNVSTFLTSIQTAVFELELIVSDLRALKLRASSPNMHRWLDREIAVFETKIRELSAEAY